MRVIVVVSLVVAVAVAAVVAVVVVGDDGSRAERAVERYLDAWSRGDDAAARATSRPRQASKALRASRRGLDGARVSARVIALKESDERADARVRVTWTVPRFGRFSYETACSCTPPATHGRSRGARRRSIRGWTQTAAWAPCAPRRAAGASSIATGARS